MIDFFLKIIQNPLIIPQNIKIIHITTQIIPKMLNLLDFMSQVLSLLQALYKSL